MLTINIQDSAHYTQKISIEGVNYIFRFDYYARTDAWYLAIGDGQGVSLASGRKLVRGWNPLLRDKNEALPGGEFFVTSSSDAIGRAAFKGGVASLVYFTQAEVDLLSAFADDDEQPFIEAAP